MMDMIWEQLMKIAESSNGFIRTAQVEEAGLSRMHLGQYVNAGRLERIAKGLYVPIDGETDEYALLQARSSKAVYSYGTALFFWGLSDRTPHVLDLTVPQGTNMTKIKRDNPDVRIHYVMPEIYGLGLAATKSPQGGTISLYDKERCICDLIRAKAQMDLQLYTQALKDYFKNHTNSRKLLKYGKQLGIEEQIRTYMEVLM